jgi:putative ABC transport system permease protein
MGNLLQDLRYGTRMLLRSPSFTAVAVVTLALGIGANTAVFSVVNAVLLRSVPLSYTDPDRLAYLYVGNVKQGDYDDEISIADFVDWRNQNHVFQRLAAFRGAWFTLTGGVEPQRVHGDLITYDWLPTLGVNVALGRNLLPEEERPGRSNVVILSSDCWRRRFNADPNMLGKTLALNGQPFTVVGILPGSFNFDDRELFAAFDVTNFLSDRHTLSATHALARLKAELYVPAGTGGDDGHRTPPGNAVSRLE